MYLYCVSSTYTRNNGLYKLGMTTNPIHRLRQYNTGDAPGIGLEKEYNFICLTNGQDSSDLRSFETLLLKKFDSLRQSGTEWFRIAVDEVREFLSKQNFFVRFLNLDEITLIKKKASEIEETLYEKFLRVFLPGKVPRRVQVELWNQWKEICECPDPLSYKGIVQWPTGVGKTIAILMLIVLAAERSKHRGLIYRGLFVSPKNDILDTISEPFKKLSEFGITMYDGSHGKLSNLSIPSDKYAVVMSCHQALTSNEGMRKLPSMNHIHYDEVHRSTGEQYFKLLKEMSLTWGTEFLTGTSATPLTCSGIQREKIAELFGDPITLLHRCNMDEAIQEGWIAIPRIHIAIGPPLDETDAHIKGYLEAIKKIIYLKNCGGKYISYLPSIADVRECCQMASNVIPEASIYKAVDERNDKEFCDSPIDQVRRILFACQRYREGSDIHGLELVTFFAGNTIAVHILLQALGRALRNDYEGKEGWCLIYRPSEEGTTEQDVLNRIALDILDFTGDGKRLEPKDIKRMLKSFIGSINLSNGSCSIEETIERAQAAYVRREYTRQPLRIREICKSQDIHTSSEYNHVRESLGFPEEPWVQKSMSAYDFFNGDDQRISQETFRTLLRENKIITTAMYESWLANNPDYPSIENINDGYFSLKASNIQEFFPSLSRRR